MAIFSKNCFFKKWLEGLSQQQKKILGFQKMFNKIDRLKYKVSYSDLHWQKCIMLYYYQFDYYCLGCFVSRATLFRLHTNKYCRNYIEFILLILQ